MVFFIDSKAKVFVVFLLAVLLIFFSDNIYLDYVDYDNPMINALDAGKEEIEEKWTNMSFRITMVAALLFGMVFYMEVERLRAS